jgi:hypothetical protein
MQTPKMAWRSTVAIGERVTRMARARRSLSAVFSAIETIGPRERSDADVEEPHA